MTVLNMAKPSRETILGKVGPFSREGLTMPPPKIVLVVCTRIPTPLFRIGSPRLRLFRFSRPFGV